ncbi:hypothetical protein FA15DRAFT_564796, partial [Coprinopsis marcescibilis]
ITLNHNTINNHMKGMPSIRQSNAERAWLTELEEEEVIKAIIQHGELGIPFLYAHLEEQVNSICKAQLGKQFPALGVGKNY